MGHLPLKDGTYINICRDIVTVKSSGDNFERRHVGGMRFYHDDKPITREEAEQLRAKNKE